MQQLRVRFELSECFLVCVDIQDKTLCQLCCIQGDKCAPLNPVKQLPDGTSCQFGVCLYVCVFSRSIHIATLTQVLPASRPL